MQMNIFETVKAAVTVRQAAEHYGLKINRSGMIQRLPARCAPGMRSLLQRIPTLRGEIPHFSATSNVDRYFISVSSLLIHSSFNYILFTEQYQPILCEHCRPGLAFLQVFRESF